MKKIEAKVICDSITEQGHRATTFVLTFPRFILAELNTHRLFSKNSASSRAIPFKKMVEMVNEDPFIPIAWQKDHKGMQGTEYFTSESGDNIHAISEGWLDARDAAIQIATGLHNLGVTKQLVNRLLEPFMWHTVVLTSTEFENFFEQRCPQYIDERTVKNDGGSLFYKSKKEYIFQANTNEYEDFEEWSYLDWAKLNQGQGEIHMMELAECMYDALNESEPKFLAAGEYHLPYVREEEMSLKDVFKVSVARCARASYNNFEGNSDVEKDIALYEKLVVSKPGHYSPTEHVLRAMGKEEYYANIQGKLPVSEYIDGTLFIPEIYLEGKHAGIYEESSKIYGWCRNMRGFIQHRVEIGG